MCSKIIYYHKHNKNLFLIFVNLKQKGISVTDRFPPSGNYTPTSYTCHLENSQALSEVLDIYLHKHF